MLLLTRVLKEWTISCKFPRQVDRPQIWNFQQQSKPILGGKSHFSTNINIVLSDGTADPTCWTRAYQNTNVISGFTHIYEKTFSQDGCLLSAVHKLQNGRHFLSPHEPEHREKYRLYHHTLFIQTIWLNQDGFHCRQLYPDHMIKQITQAWVLWGLGGGRQLLPRMPCVVHIRQTLHTFVRQCSHFDNEELGQESLGSLWTSCHTVPSMVLCHNATVSANRWAMRDRLRCGKLYAIMWQAKLVIIFQLMSRRCRIDPCSHFLQHLFGGVPSDFYCWKTCTVAQYRFGNIAWQGYSYQVLSF